MAISITNDKTARPVILSEREKSVREYFHCLIYPNQILRYAQNDIAIGLVSHRFLTYVRNDTQRERLPRRVQRTLLGVTNKVLPPCHSEEDGTSDVRISVSTCHCEPSKARRGNLNHERQNRPPCHFEQTREICARIFPLSYLPQPDSSLRSE